MEAFKQNDAKELQVVNTTLPTLTQLGNDRDSFYAGAFTCYVLGDVIFNLNACPLADAIPQDAFRVALASIVQLFTRPGTFEYYLDLLRDIFGESVDVTFTIPSPGILQIDIDSLTTVQEDFVARKIIDNAYTFDQVVTEDGDVIAFQQPLGIKTQSEMDALLVELYPAGVRVKSTLTVG